MTTPSRAPDGTRQTRRPRWPRPTIRLRLTLLYAGMFFLAGLALVALTYVLVERSLPYASVKKPSVVLMNDTKLTVAEQETIAKKVAHAQDTFREDTLDALLTQSALALGLVGIAAAGIGWLIARRALAPIHQITATARRVADRSLHERIGLTGPRDELTELADTFDAMLERLDRSFDGQRRFVGNASHELRTPLAINRTLLEVALARPSASPELTQLGENLLAVNQRSERLIDGLLTLARSDNALTTRVRVDIAEVTRHVLDQVRAQGVGSSLDWTLDLRPAEVRGDPVLVERLVTNLVDNAVRHNRPGGSVAVTTTTNGGRAKLVVDNSGPPVAAYEVEGLFEPFRRGNGRAAVAHAGAAQAGADRGVGLGLSIVRSVAHAHGGDAAAEPGSDGGLRVRVCLPSG
ncbi:sensor histidine kinase [Actinopolymorpha pittospori]